ncbi:MAG TPA: hypothetical protein VGE34_02765 [Candidatus Saccharimonadales bacterium]
MLTQGSNEPLFARAEFSGNKASLIADKLQQLALALAWTSDPTSSSEQTDLTLTSSHRISAIHTTTQGSKTPRRVLQLSGPNIPNISWQTSSDGKLWRNTHTFGSVSQLAFNSAVRHVVAIPSSPSDTQSEFDMEKLSKAPADEAFDMLGSWARHKDGATFTTEDAYEDESNKDNSISRLFTMKTVNSHDKSEVSYELEVSDSQAIGQAVLYRTVRIGSLQKRDYKKEAHSFDVYAGVLLESEGMTSDELATTAEQIRLDDSAAISAYIQSSMQPKQGSL